MLPTATNELVFVRRGDREARQRKTATGIVADGDEDIPSRWYGS